MEPTVIHIAHYKAVYSGNFIASLRALERLLKEHGVRTVYALSEAARERDWAQEMISEGSDLQFLPLPCSFMRTLKAARGLIGKYHPTILHTHFAHHQGACILAASVAPRGRRSFVLCHAHDAPESLSPLREIARRLRYQLMRGAIVTSDRRHLWRGNHG